MPGISATQLGDLILLTQRNQSKNQLTQIAQSLQKYPAAREFFRKNRMDLDSGPYWEFQVMTTLTRNSRWVGLYEPDILEQADGTRKGLMELRHLTTGMLWDAREIDLNRGERRILELMKIRRLQMMIDNVEQFEDRVWTLTSASDTKTVYGNIPYFIVKSASTGFNTTLPSGYSTVANIIPATQASYYANYAAPYTDITYDDLIEVWKTATYQTDWTPAAEGIPDYTKGNDMAFYCNLTTILKLEKLLKQQNDNIGTNLAGYMGKVQFMGTPIIYVPKLNSDTTNPVYGLQYADWKVAVLRGWWMKETVIPVRHDAHTTASLHLDWTLTPVCTDRRTQFVLSAGTTQL